MSNTLSPIGIEPKWVWQQKRRNNLAGAINRYLEAGIEVNPLWVEEYNQLEKEIEINKTKL